MILIFFRILNPLRILAALALMLPMTLPLRAETTSPFASGWRLDPEASALRFVSVKNGDIAESSHFGTLSGVITDQGRAQIRVLLDSVDSGIDLRNVRLRFMLFETFLHPEAIVTAQLDAAALGDLAGQPRSEIDLTYALSLHGVTLDDTVRVAVIPMGPDRMLVSSIAPIPVSALKFGMGDGIAKMQEAAEVAIVPVGVVSFDFQFERGGADPAAAAPVTAAAAPAAGMVPAASAAAPVDCSAELAEASRTGDVAFAAGSARLTTVGTAALVRVADILRNCPDRRIEIAGHTDSDGGAQTNLRLSQARADAVAAALAELGIPRAQLSTVGYGEDRPRVPNTSAANKALNRRIEFSTLP